MYNSIMFPCEEKEQGEKKEEEEDSDGCGRPEVVFLVKIICVPQWGGEGEEVQMEICLVGGDAGLGYQGWGSQMLIAACSQKRARLCACVCMCL